jgi:DnaJ domain
MNLRNASDSQSGPVYWNREVHNTRLRELDLKSLACVALPRAQRWEEARSDQTRKVPEAQDEFEVRDAKWRLTTVEKLPAAERPDPAFRRLYPIDSGLVMIDDLGKARGWGPIRAAALRYDRNGRLAAQAGFARGIYRVGVHPLGRGLMAMSADCVLHAYREDLHLLFETTLADTPQIQALGRRFDLGTGRLKNLIRCVALSRDHQRYLFTAVDEAWCVNRRGQTIWGLRLPMQEGWRRTASPGERFGLSSEVTSALALMKLSLPLTPEQIKRRYRELALQWHPDHNHGHPQAQEKMKGLNSALELLTSIDLSIPTEARLGTFVRDEDRLELDLGGNNFSAMFSFGNELLACDWIYAADFAAHSNSVYLGAYSGRLVMVDAEGKGLRVYDIGSTPKRIIDTGDFLYILTHTRLLILRNDALHALVHVPDRAELVVAQSGFGVLENKRWCWFSSEGQYLGSVLTKDPIRRVYCAADSMLMETRQRRAVISGAPPWWE